MHLFNRLLITLCAAASLASCSSEAQWITADAPDVDSTNTWISFRKDFTLSAAPANAEAVIAADSKYWLWVNGELAVFEGQLKRGPNPEDTYYDRVDLTKYLKEGKNDIALLLWYFGKDGFSHKSSGQSGVYFDLDADGTHIVSDSTWLSIVNPAYGTCGDPAPNFRLAESNIRYDANVELTDWITADPVSLGMKPSVNRGPLGSAPWNNLVERPIPMWRDYGVVDGGAVTETLTDSTRNYSVALPYNMQVTPVITLTDPDGGTTVNVETDHAYAGSAYNVRAEYVTRPGQQTYESLGWMNGEKIVIRVPADSKVTVDAIAYRQTGYDTDLSQTFESDNEFINRFWQKALRTLYVNMRDTYFDCPDRERAQWWGDEVVLMGESFYTATPSIHLLMKKGIHELMDWQRPDSTIFSPIPAGNWNKELPAQMLASVGRYGFWNYYVNTGDTATIAHVYPAVKRYLGVWQLDDTGLTVERSGEWSWGDWGKNIDLRLVLAGWHYMALEAAIDMARLTGNEADIPEFEATMARIKDAYNACWNGKAYRHPDYEGDTDDRVQALAVIAGIAPVERYDDIYRLLQTQEHASPYMDKYVMEALFQMGHGDYALKRFEKRFGPMVNDPSHTTLFEGWEEGGFGGGSTNHAWSGGALTVISRYVFGLYPIEPGFRTFAVEPDMTGFKHLHFDVPTLYGTISETLDANADGTVTMQLTVPEGTTARLSDGSTLGAGTHTVTL